MPLTYERPSALAPNGRYRSTPTSGYSSDEIAERTDVPRAAAVLAISGLETSASAASGAGCRQYAAMDVVRLAVMDRLMRSGVPVACAAAMVRAAENLATAAV